MIVTKIIVSILHITATANILIEILYAILMLLINKNSFKIMQTIASICYILAKSD